MSEKKKLKRSNGHVTVVRGMGGEGSVGCVANGHMTVGRWALGGGGGGGRGGKGGWVGGGPDKGVRGGGPVGGPSSSSSIMPVD